MALGRRALGPRWVVLVGLLSNGQPFFDPAIDPEKSDITKYFESLFDVKYIQYAPNEEPTLFLINQLTSRQRDNLDSCLGKNSRESYLIRCSVASIKNFKILQEDGSYIEAPQPDRINRGEGPIASEEWFEKLNLQSDVKEALASMIWKISEAHLPLSQRFGQLVGQENIEKKGNI